MKTGRAVRTGEWQTDMQPCWHRLFARLQTPASLSHPYRGLGGEIEGRAGNDLWPSGPPLKFLARGAASLYGLGALARRRAYDRGWFKVQHLPAPVISVGNLTVGGTGKTPVVACLARLLLARGKHPAILSRGYGGRAVDVTRLSDGRRIYLKPPEVGEEAYWLARALPGVAVYTGPGRYAAGLAAWRELRPDLFLLDDGFQHFQLHRDLDIVLLDAEHPFGNGRLLPAGPLREPPSVLAAAQVLILTRFMAERHQDQLHTIQRLFPDKTVLTAAILPTAAKLYPGERSEALAGLAGQPLFAFAGLARPGVFEATLGDLGVDLKGFRRFGDHHAYSRKDLQELMEAARDRGARALITTAKDWAGLGENWEAEPPLWVLEVEAQIADIAALERLMESLGEGARGQGPVTNQGPGARGQGSGAGGTGVLACGSHGPPPPTLPLPPEVAERFQELGVSGQFAGDLGRVRRLLVRAPNWLGDAVMGLPTLHGLRDFFPQAEMAVLAAPSVAPLFTGQPGVAEIIDYPTGGGKWPRLWELRGRYDLSLALPNSLASAFGLWLAGVPDRVGYDADGRRLFLTVAVTGRQRLAGLHTVYYLLGLLQAFGEVKNLTPPALYPAAAEVQAAMELLGKPGLAAGGPWVGLSPGAAYGPAKRWPPERFAALGALLQEEFGARLVLLGGPEDRSAADQVKDGLSAPALDLVGRTSLPQALAVLSRLQLLITNDSGLMHAAAALGVAVVAIFGSTDPGATGPFTCQATVLHHPRPCGPCFKRTCDTDDYACLTDISVAAAATAARRWLGDGEK
jgi:lipopolysaccharide heptosyltransferase II/tetraacyldisaccharide 4'-kinase